MRFERRREDGAPRIEEGRDVMWDWRAEVPDQTCRARMKYLVTSATVDCCSHEHREAPSRLGGQDDEGINWGGWKSKIANDNSERELYALDLPQL